MKRLFSLGNLAIILSALSFSKFLNPSFYATQILVPFCLVFVLGIVGSNNQKISIKPVHLILIAVSIYFIFLDLYFSNGTYFSLTSISFLTWTLIVIYCPIPQDEFEKIIIKLAFLMGAICLFQIFYNSNLNHNKKNQSI